MNRRHRILAYSLFISVVGGALMRYGKTGNTVKTAAATVSANATAASGTESAVAGGSTTNSPLSPKADGATHTPELQHSR